MSLALPAQAVSPAKMSENLPPKVLKVDKKLPVRVSEAPIKPAKDPSSTGSLLKFSAASQESFPSPSCLTGCSSLLIRVLNMTTQTPASSVSASVLEPGNLCFLLQGVLWYRIQVHAVIHEELVSARNLGQGLLQGVHLRAPLLLPGNLPRGAVQDCPVRHRVIMKAEEA